MRRIHPFLPSRATDGGVHRRVVPEVYESALSWLGPAPSGTASARYEVFRRGVIRAELDRLVACHSIAEGQERAQLAAAIAAQQILLAEATT